MQGERGLQSAGSRIASTFPVRDQRRREVELKVARPDSEVLATK